MNIQVFKKPGWYITREYDLTNCSIEELERALIRHCDDTSVYPSEAAILKVSDDEGPEIIIKGTSTQMNLYEVATEILKLYRGEDFSAGYNEVKFTEPPRIGNRCDALELLDTLIKADDVIGDRYALEALKNAIERGIV